MKGEGGLSTEDCSGLGHAVRRRREEVAVPGSGIQPHLRVDIDSPVETQQLPSGVGIAESPASSPAVVGSTNTDERFGRSAVRCLCHPSSIA